MYGTYPVGIDTCQGAKWAFGMNSSLLCLANAMIISMIANPTTTIDVAHAQNTTCKAIAGFVQQSGLARSRSTEDCTQGVLCLSLDHATIKMTQVPVAGSCEHLHNMRDIHKRMQ